jgi:hypothetical protein
LDDSELKPQHFKVKADWSLNEVAPFLPKKVIYYSDGMLRWRTGGRAYTAAAPPPYDHGFTNFIYEELSSTNSNGIEIPTKFRFARYGFVETNFQIIHLVSGKIDTITPKISVFSFKPPYIGEIRILDKRYGSSNPPLDDFIFPAKDGNWTSTNADQIYQQDLRMRSRIESGRKGVVF